MIICFIIPALATIKRKDTIETVINEDIAKDEVETKKYKYKKYGIIKLLHTKSGQIEEIPIDEYLYNVVSAEMPVDFEKEALKAQAVVARTYTLYQIQHSNGKHNNADICDESSCCQAWISKEERLEKWDEPDRENNWNKIVEAVDTTAGNIITFNNEPIDAFFHSNSGGKTELPVNVWGGTDYPYLQSVETSGEDEYSQYSSNVSLTKEELIRKLKENHKDILIDYSKPECIKILEYTDGGRVKTIQFGNVNISGVEARKILGLKSTNFNFKIDNDNVIFDVIGYGHGVGLSQTGSDSMAKAGKNYEEIIKHFYTGVEIKDINSIE